MTQGESTSIDLEDIFFLDGRPSKQYLLKLSSTILSITPKINDNVNRTLSKDSACTISIDDIYGCLCMKSKKDSTQCHLGLYLYVLRKAHGISRIFSKKSSLHRKQHIFTYGKYNDYETNFGEILRWHRYVTYAIYLRRNLPLDIVTTKRDKRLLVFINPAGGAGRAHRLIMEYVVGVWSEAELNYQLVLTEYAGHARDFVQSLELNEWSGIVVASGDGLVFEVINGLFHRNDWQEALKLPIGHLPGGSGNAFITNIIRHSKQPLAESMEKFIVQSAIIVATHQVLPFDMAIIDTCDGQRVLSFLCIEWCILADVDLESEKYRFLGETRFMVEGVKQIIRHRSYMGYIEYLPYDVTTDVVQTNQIISNTPITQIHRHLVPLNEPISTDPTTSKWRRIDGPFAHVLVTSKSSISKDTISTPQSTLSDGYLTLQYVRSEDATRWNLVKAFAGLSDGSHFQQDFLKWIQVRAFRIVPTDTNGNIMVDGEKVSFGPIQGEVLPNIGRCMGRQPKDN